MTKRIIAALAVLCLLLLCGCRQEPRTVEVPSETTELTEAPTTEATEPPPVRTVALHSGLKEDGSFDSGTLFIGDSLTNGFVFDNLMLYNRLGDARFMAIVGAPVHAYFSGPVLSKDISCIYNHIFEGKIMYEGVEIVGQEITAVYFMMGTNYSAYTTYETYEQIVEHLLASCPQATIYLQKVPFSSSENVFYDEVNAILEQVYLTYAESVDTRVMLIDTYTAIDDNLVFDGIHINGNGQEAWYQAIVSFAENNNIPQ